ncbi:hypothetical protein [Heyndrickxia acidiproducens]|uniref:hypothetical protein n=1 Tax=Heyndrickxia acidiproducens TaxID=1121084 RepID=UPI001F41D870|nr:hypothetical protein [Heyndrickxia acidiproducens]
MLTEGEEQLIDAFILLPLARKTLAWDKKAIEASAIKFKEPYIRAIENMLARLSHDLYSIKRETGRQQMKFYKRSDLDYTVFVRGWRFERRYHPSIAADWVKERVTNYLLNS